MSLELPSLGFAKVASIIRADACGMGRGTFEMKPLLCHCAILLCSKIKICNFFCHYVLFTIFFHSFFHNYCWKKLSFVFLVLVLSVHLKSKKRCCYCFSPSTVFFPIGDDSWLIKYS